ncbi:hypothetical protein C8R43DRAFT_941572 [Mycena crocata]|nr:hypothetical protein C8R43DRAFT_941572 [Mycena crocata]
MQMRQFQGELKSLGQNIEDADFAVALLGSLPDDWDSFVQATLTSLTAPDSKTVISLIHTEEARRSQRAESSTALVSRARPTRTATTHYPKRLAITAAPSSAPVIASSRKNTDNPTSSSDTFRKDVFCHKCGGKGHFARVCPSQMDDETQAQVAYDYEDFADFSDDGDYSDADTDHDFAF